MVLIPYFLVSLLLVVVVVVELPMPVLVAVQAAVLVERTLLTVK
jgi:hypothetical protein